MIFYFIVSAFLLLVLRAYKNFILYFFRVKYYKKKEKDRTAKGFTERSRSTLWAFVNSITKNNLLFGQLIYPKSYPNWILGSNKHTNTIIPIISGINGFLLPFALSSFIFYCLQLWVNLTFSSDSFDTIVQIEKSRDYLVSIKSKISILGIPSHISLFGLILLFSTLSLIPLFRKSKILIIPLKGIKIIQATYIFLVLSTSFTFFSDTVAQGPLTERIDKMESKISIIKEKYYSAYEKSLNIEVEKTAVEIAKSQRVDSVIHKIQKIEKTVQEIANKNKRATDEAYEINERRRKAEYKFNYPFVVFPEVKSDFSDWIQFSSQYFQNEYKNFSDYSTFKDVDEPETYNPDENPSPKPSSPSPTPLNKDEKPFKPKKEISADINNLSEETIDLAIEHLNQEQEKINSKINDLPKTQKIIFEAANSALNKGVIYGEKAIIDAIADQIATEAPILATLVRQIANEVIPRKVNQWAGKKLKTLINKLVNKSSLNTDVPETALEIRDFLKNLSFEKEILDIEKKTIEISEQSISILNDKERILSHARSKEKLWIEKDKKRREEAIRLKEIAKRKETAILNAENEQLKRKIIDKINSLEFYVNSPEDIFNEINGYITLSDEAKMEMIKQLNSYGIYKNSSTKTVSNFQKNEYLNLLTDVPYIYGPKSINKALTRNLEKISLARSNLELANIIIENKLSGSIEICARCGLPLSVPYCLAK
ncbi:MAG TPA: hypothetical protein PLZ12_20920 [Saprospiraceae bacterium]|nr:hypothetical protein [Saprospiraceae bacterium]